jgi:hypothetical protein
MMKRYLLPLVIIALICALLLAGVVVAQPGEKADAAGVYAVEQGTASGGSYHLAGLVWQFRGTASNGHYRLVEPADSSAGCCCTYLPCLLRSP